MRGQGEVERGAFPHFVFFHPDLAATTFLEMARPRPTPVTSFAGRGTG